MQCELGRLRQDSSGAKAPSAIRSREPHLRGPRPGNSQNILVLSLIPLPVLQPVPVIALPVLRGSVT